MILQLHRDLYRFTGDSFAGRWKDSDNVIAERSASGEMVARFRPTSAAATPAAVDAICREYRAQIEAGTYDPVLVSLVFVFDFVSIHPFNDGNGRMSRLLTLLLLYRCGYTVGKYVSIEKEIERSKETYYEALGASSAGWQDGENDYTPFVTYMLGVMTACYKELDGRFAIAAGPKGGEGMLRAYFEQLVGAATKRDIMDANPSISKRTVERVLKKLKMTGPSRRRARRGLPHIANARNGAVRLAERVLEGHLAADLAVPRPSKAVGRSCSTRPRIKRRGRGARRRTCGP
ncbi:MAG: Fic family protein [Eggerthellaceae bacterium]